MKSFSNTALSVIFAVGVTIIVALLIKIPFFADKETQTTDEMMLLRYELHNKYSPIKPDAHIVVASIDERSLQDFGRWPFSRSIHGDFLLLLSQDKPKTVGWDVFFTEPETASSAAAPAPAADSTSAPNAGQAPAASAPDTQNAAPVAPANPPPASTNSGTPAAPSTPAAGSTGSVITPDSVPIGAGAPAAPATPAPAPAPANAAPAAAPAQPVASTAPSLDPDDQHFVDAATLFPSMVTAAEKSNSPQILWNAVASTSSDQNNTQPPALTDQDFAPTKPFKHVAGDASKTFIRTLGLAPLSRVANRNLFWFRE